MRYGNWVKAVDPHRSPSRIRIGTRALIVFSLCLSLASPAVASGGGAGCAGCFYGRPLSQVQDLRGSNAPDDQDEVAGSKTTISNGVFRNKMTILGLVRTHRRARSWKTAKLVPGKETAWFYTVLKPDGSVITKEADHRLPGVRDDRPWKERRPNCWTVWQLLTFTVSPTVGLGAGFLAARR